MSAATSLSCARQRVVDHDQWLAARFPRLAVTVHTAVITGQPFDRPRDELHRALTKSLRLHRPQALFEDGCRDRSEAVTRLAGATAAQHRALAARLDEVAEATTGLDAVAITRVLHALLTLHQDLEHGLHDALHRQEAGGHCRVLDHSQRHRHRHRGGSRRDRVRRERLDG